jgi:GDSL-like Lipase/Acylhydrolase family
MRGRDASVWPVALLIAAALAIAGAALSAHAAGAASRAGSIGTTVYPDDPGLRYTEYAHAAISHSAAVFDRPGVANGNAIASPGTRINFRTDATRVSIIVTYTFACGATGCGRFSVTSDGRLLLGSFGSDTTAGTSKVLIASQLLPATHSYSVAWPYGTQMVFGGLVLEGGQHRLFVPEPTRPIRRYVAYGDSITQGYYASGVIHTYPYLVADRKGWSVVNMGFGGETTVASDGTAVGLLGGNIVTVAIGVNDWGTSKPIPSFELGLRGAPRRDSGARAHGAAVLRDADLDRRRDPPERPGALRPRLPAGDHFARPATDGDRLKPASDRWADARSEPAQVLPGRRAPERRRLRALRREPGTEADLLIRVTARSVRPFRTRSL